MARTGEPASRHIVVVQRTVAVLEALADAGAAMGTNELARRTEVNASTVSRILATLAESGIVQHEPDTGRYRLGLRLLQLGNAAVSGLELREVARVHLQELARESEETATLSVAGEREAVTIDYVQSPQSVRSVIGVGRTSVAHATAAGKVFLAHGGALPPGELKGYTPRTVTDRAELAAEVDRVREHGWAQAIGEREEDLNAIAAPILGSDGGLTAILGVQGPAMRFTPARMRAALVPLRRHAATLARAW